MLKHILLGASLSAAVAVGSFVALRTAGAKREEFNENAREVLVAQRFRAESPDPAWHPEAELRALVLAALKPGDRVRAIDCKTSLCRLETTHANDDGQRALVLALSLPRPDRPPLFGGALFTEAVASGSSRELRSTAYLLRTGYAMPSPTP